MPYIIQVNFPIQNTRKLDFQSSFAATFYLFMRNQKLDCKNHTVVIANNLEKVTFLVFRVIPIFIFQWTFMMNNKMLNCNIETKVQI